MGTQAKKAPREKTAFSEEVVHSNQGNESVPWFDKILCPTCYYILPP